LTYYCSASDVGMRLGLNSAQRTAASSKITSVIRRASIDIDQTYRDYGRSAPSKSIASSTLNGGISAGATTVTLASASSFGTAGNGDIDGDSFAWTGKSSNDLTGCTGISADHLTGTAVNEGEEAHVLREICADLAASLYFEDEALFQTTGTPGGIRGTAMNERGTENLRRLAHLGSVD